MSGAKKIWISTALLLVLVGVVLSVGTLVMIGFDFSRLNTMEFVTNTYEVEQPFTHISVEAAEADIRLVRSETNECKVVCTEGDKITHTVTVRENTLFITRRDERKWYERSGIYWGDMSITVYLPGDSYDSLSISTMSSDVTVPEEFTFETVQIDTASGEISFTAAANKSLRLKTLSGDLTVTELTAETLTLQTTSGNMELTGLFADSATISTTSGDLTLRTVRAQAELSVKTVSGDLKLEDTSARTLTLQATSGDLHLTDTTASDRMELETVSGDVKLERCDGGSLRIKTVSGDVRGTLRSGKRFEAHTTSGTMDVPYSVPDGGACEIITTSGDAAIRVEG